MAEDPRLPVTVTREQLYEQVWATPVRTLARGYGISDVALGKICKKLNVPRPGPGYWAVVRYGRAPEKPALAPLTRETLASFVIRGASHPSPSASERAVRPKVDVPTTLERAHPAVRDVQRILREPFDGELFMLHSPGFTPFRVSRSSVDRALRLLDGLCRALEARGHTLALHAKPESHRVSRTLKATVGDRNVDIGITERITQKDHVLTAKESRRRQAGEFMINTPRYDYTPSGRLTLKLEAPWGTLSRRSWSDGERRRLEDVLGEVVLAIEATAKRIHEAEDQRERERRAELEDARQRALAQARLQHETALAKDLAGMAVSWEEAKRLRAFLAAVEQSAEVDAEAEGFVDWLAWAHRRAETLDPLSRPKQIAKVLEPDLRRAEEAWEAQQRGPFYR